MGKKQQQDMMSSWCDNAIINEITIAVWDIWLDAVGMAVYYYIFVGSKTAFIFFFSSKTLLNKSKNMYSSWIRP